MTTYDCYYYENIDGKEVKTKIAINLTLKETVDVIIEWLIGNKKGFDIDKIFDEMSEFYKLPFYYGNTYGFDHNEVVSFLMDKIHNWEDLIYLCVIYGDNFKKKWNLELKIPLK